MNATLHPLAVSYLREVERGLAPLPRGRRDEVVADLREHLDASIGAAESEADVRNVLDRLGEPRDVAAAALAEAGVVVSGSKPVMEWFAVALVSFGSLLVPVVGWLVGIVLVFASSIWQRRHKAMAALLVPFGWLPAIYFVGAPVRTCFETTGPEGTTTTCGGGSWLTTFVGVPLLVVAIVGPLVTVFVLLRALIRHREATAL